LANIYSINISLWEIKLSNSGFDFTIELVLRSDYHCIYCCFFWKILTKGLGHTKQIGVSPMALLFIIEALHLFPTVQFGWDGLHMDGHETDWAPTVFKLPESRFGEIDEITAREKILLGIEKFGKQSAKQSFLRSKTHALNGMRYSMFICEIRKILKRTHERDTGL